MLVSKDKISENLEEEEEEEENLWRNITSFSSLGMKNEMTDRISLNVIISSEGGEKEIKRKKRKNKEKRERKNIEKRKRKKKERWKSFPEKFKDFFIHPFNLIHNEIH